MTLFLAGAVALGCRGTDELPRDQLAVNGEVMDLDTLERRLDAGELVRPGQPFEVLYPRVYTRGELHRLIRLVRDGVQGQRAGEVTVRPHGVEP